MEETAEGNSRVEKPIHGKIEMNASNIAGSTNPLQKENIEISNEQFNFLQNNEDTVAFKFDGAEIENIYLEIKNKCKLAICIIVENDLDFNGILLRKTLGGIKFNLSGMSKLIEPENILICVFFKEIRGKIIFNEQDKYLLNNELSYLLSRKLYNLESDIINTHCFCKMNNFTEVEILNLYYCTIIENTKINPFKKDIQFCFEFIDGEIPYVTILTEINEQLMNDNRNYYRCLTKEHNYIFHLDKFKTQKQILESMIQGIGNFLTFVNESLSINTFVYFGEYEFNHTYQINDFLQNKAYLNFYRINEIINKNQEEKYIFFTKLYFLLFEPLKEDKALIKLELCEILKDINISFDKNDIKDSLILKMSSHRFNEETIEFFLIDRKRNTKEEKEIKEIKEDNNKEKKDSINNENNNEDVKNINILDKLIFFFII
jgi:hypothetical protein